MTFGAGRFGEGLFGAPTPSGGNDGPYSLTVHVRVIVVAGQVALLRAPVAIKVKSDVALVAPVRIDVTQPVVALVVPVTIRVSQLVSLAVPIAVNVSAPVTTPEPGGEAFTWSAVVTVGGVDVSARLTGQITVEAAENAARVAHLSLAPAGQQVALADLARKPVTVSLERFDASGTRTGLYRLFTGLVDTPEYESATRVLTLACSDARQSKIAAMPRPLLDALVPTGVWSPFVFDRYATSEQYLADRLGTTAGAVDGDAYGALAFTPWAGTPSRTITDAEILDETLVPALAGATSARRTRLTVTYRRPQAVVRGIAFQYQAPSLVTQAYMGIRALTRSAVEQALGGTGATVASPISFVDYPARATIENVGAVVTADAQALCLGASCWLNRRYSRWIDETWVVAIGTEGTLTEESRAVSVEWDPSDSNHRRLPANAVTAFAVEKRDGPVPYIAPRHAAGETRVDYVPPDQPDAAAFTVAYAASVRTAARQVAESLRGSSIRFAMLLDPGITLRSFLAVDTEPVSGAGKVTRLVHRMDIDAGTAITEVEVECVSVTLPPVSPPSRPMIPTAIKPGSLHANCQTWIGGVQSAPAWDEKTMFGFSTNAAMPAPGTNLFPEQFSLEVPGIEDAAQGAVAPPPTCMMTAGSPVLTALTSTDGFAADVEISGPGIPAGTTVLDVNATARTATLSHAATSSGVEREVRVETRQYIPRIRVTYSPVIVRNGPTVGA